MNIREETLRQLSQLYTFHFENDQGSCHYWNEPEISEIPLSKCTMLIINWSLDKNGEPERFLGKSLRLPKKMEITLAWILGKIENGKAYQSFAEQFNCLLNKKFPNRFLAYPTTYGIGVFIIFGGKRTGQEIELIKKELESRNIQYQNEFSKAHWVYRFKISKAKENIEKLKSIS